MSRQAVRDWFGVGNRAGLENRGGAFLKHEPKLPLSRVKERLVGRRIGTNMADLYAAEDGCSVTPHCVDCPLPMCRYEHPGGLRAVLNLYRDQKIWELLKAEVPAEEIARVFKISRRNVFRIQTKMRDLAGHLDICGPCQRRERGVHPMLELQSGKPH